jgi:hypothetical protein
VGVGIYFDKERVLTGRLPDCVFFSSIKICKMGEMEQKTRESKRRAIKKGGRSVGWEDDGDLRKIN